jgi:hypothetical protein
MEKMDSPFGGLFEALAFLACAISFFVLMVCVKNDSTLHRMKKSLNRIERQMGLMETHEITFREFREILRTYDPNSKGDDDDDYSD